MTGPLPFLWQKPPFQTLLTTLQSLCLQPPSWSPKTTQAEILEQQQAQADAAKEVVDFLSSIIKSPLAWIDSDDEREKVWEEASRRLAERCGRNAMGEIIRNWYFAPYPRHEFVLSIREPPLTGDALGLKTWTSSYILAKLLPKIGNDLFMSHFFEGSRRRPPKILELGSGTGLLGLAAACLWHTDVVLTDLPLIVPNLRHNVWLNQDTVQEKRGKVEAAALTWGGVTDDEIEPRFTKADRERYELIIVADPLYDDDHPALLAGAIDSLLGFDEEARVLVMVPQRDETTRRLQATFEAAMREKEVPMECMSDELVTGEDGWEDAGDDAGSDGFWWGIFWRRKGE